MIAFMRCSAKPRRPGLGLASQASHVYLRGCLYQGCSLGIERLGLEVVSRHFLERLVLVLKVERLGLKEFGKIECLGLVSVLRVQRLSLVLVLKI